MGLSRLDNFLKSVRGEILYVDPSSIDSTDSIDNQGNSLARPFKTIQRALVEAARFSYQGGFDNDRFNNTTIMLYPGEHIVDNRPGWIPEGSGIFRLRSSGTSSNFNEFDADTNFDLTTDDNQLYKLNSVFGGVIVPRGTSIVGIDLRKTIIRPTYVPDPDDTNGSVIDRSAIFRLTGGCYLWQFSILDANPNGYCYKDYGNNRFTPNFSHHKLTAFEYADGVNNVDIDGLPSYSKTDLTIYYEKVGLAYGNASGRPIDVDANNLTTIDIQAKVDEYRIVGSRGSEIGITSIRSGNGVTKTTTITVNTSSSLDGIAVDTPIRIDGVAESGYDGQYLVSKINSSTELEYIVPTIPSGLAFTNVSGGTLNISVDTVTSASPYIFNCSLRSVYGMCGLHADGDKASGFKSMVVAQFTGIGLQKDPNAFVKYDRSSGSYDGVARAGNENIQTDSLARYKPSYENYHIKCSNDAYIQVVSVFAIGYANHFLAETGGDQSINNSNSNFGAKALNAVGFRNNSFRKDDVGYITHIIPPKEYDADEFTNEYISIDVSKTRSASFTPNRLYLYEYNDQNIIPPTTINGYNIGAKEDDDLKTTVSRAGVTTEYSSKIIMQSRLSSQEISSEKNYLVDRGTGNNNISSNIITLSSDHAFVNGESVRIIAENGNLPDGVNENTIYYAITSGVNSNQLKIAKTENDAFSENSLVINNSGGILHVISRVSDKSAGDPGHPIQWDNGWYVNVESSSTLYNLIQGPNGSSLGNATSRTYFTRKSSDRLLEDSLYKVRYVIPSDSSTSARPPIEGYVIQESGSTIGSTNSEVAYQFNSNPVTLLNSNELRNQSIISSSSWSAGVSTVETELPHNLSVGDTVEIINVTSSLNNGYNGTFIVTSVGSAKQFSYEVSSNPGTFTNTISNRTTSLPYFKRKKITSNLIVYRSEEIQQYISGSQDGIYHLTLINSSNSPGITPFENLTFQQPITNLYPQKNRDQPQSDPSPSKSFALPDIIGQVVSNDPQRSVTRETIEKGLSSFGIGIGVTDIISNGAGTTHTIRTSIGHGLNRLIEFSITNPGSGYGSGNIEVFYNAKLTPVSGSDTGIDATLKIGVDALGSITNTHTALMEGGSGYAVGQTYTITGLPTFGTPSPAVIQVTKIYDNVGDALTVYGVEEFSNEEFNTLYRITSVSSGTEVIADSSNTISISNTGGLGSTPTQNAGIYVSGRTLQISSIAYNNVSGTAVIQTSSNHGLSTSNKITIGGADESLYNGNFVITSVTSLNEFTVNIGTNDTIPATTGTKYVYENGINSSGGDITEGNENLSGRLKTLYGGLTGTLSAAILTRSATSCSISNIANLDIKVGDYLKIDDEIVRVKSNNNTSNPISIFRGVLGTPTRTHLAGTVVRKIKALPVELRRNSLVRASNHTFEYLGFGPGNYSTAFPERQDRTISPQEELLAQSTKISGGVVVYTGMNADGEFYVGNKKINATTGKEEVFDTPVPTITGFDISVNKSDTAFDIITPQEVTVDRSILVEGGKDGNIISQFNGPVSITKNLSVSQDIESKSILLQGDLTIARKYTVGPNAPTNAGNVGDIQFNSNPSSGDAVGWVYTSNNEWRLFGATQTTSGQTTGTFNGTFIGDGSQLTNVPGAFIFDSVGVHTTRSVGIGTTIADANYQFKVVGSSLFDGNSTFTNTITGTATTATNVIAGIASVTSFTSSGLSTIANTTNSTAYTNGALVVEGGVGIASDVYVRGGINVTGISSFVDDVYVRNQSIASLISASSIIFGI